MLEELLNIGAIVTSIAPVTLGLTEVFKRAFNIGKRFVPAISIVIGIGLCSSVMYTLGGNPLIGIFGGIVSGLMACGLYSGVKATSGN